ncbi:MAG: DUF6364 family protein [Thermodesulfobacteriota bacterium]|nr:DUF6364 family protein [Thermodesulfobacteriota bacterium]
MPNITMSMDEDLIRKARKIAVEKNTTMTAMVRSYLRKLVAREDQKKDRIIRELDVLYRATERKIGPVIWTRDELHER